MEGKRFRSVSQKTYSCAFHIHALWRQEGTTRETCNKKTRKSGYYCDPLIGATQIERLITIPIEDAVMLKILIRVWNGKSVSKLS